MPLTCGWCDAAALQVCVQLSHGCKLMGWECPNNCHTTFHMFLAVLLLLFLLLLRRRTAALAAGRLSLQMCTPPPTNGSDSLSGGLWQNVPLMVAHKLPPFCSRKCRTTETPPKAMKMVGFWKGPRGSLNRNSRKWRHLYDGPSASPPAPTLQAQAPRWGKPRQSSVSPLHHRAQSRLRNLNKIII